MTDVDGLRLETLEEWRAWLERNHAISDCVWLLFYKKHTGRTRVHYDDSVVEAIRFGWIDGKMMRVDEDTYMQRFSPRRRRSNWSVINRRRAERLIDEGLMTPAGYEKTEEAKRNGMWKRAIG